MVLAHELTHALDDQWFELHRPAAEGSAWAFRVLIEGNARRIKDAYHDAMSPVERRAAQDDRVNLARHADHRGVPDAVQEMGGYPYVGGLALVDVILDRGGQRALDRAFATPPSTAQQVMYPDLYTAGAPVVRVAAPWSPRPARYKGEFGAFFLRQVLGGHSDTAAWAARSWGGDSVVTWQAGSGYCAAISFAVRDLADLPRFTATLRAWAAGRPRGEVTESRRTITVTSCSAA